MYIISHKPLSGMVEARGHEFQSVLKQVSCLVWKIRCVDVVLGTVNVVIVACMKKMAPF